MHTRARFAYSPCGPYRRSSRRSTLRELRADENDGAKRKVARLANVDGSNEEGGRLERGSAALRDAGDHLDAIAPGGCRESFVREGSSTRALWCTADPTLGMQAGFDEPGPSTIIPKVASKSIQLCRACNKATTSFSMISGLVAPMCFAYTRPFRSSRNAIGSPRTPPYSSPVLALPITTG
jgi:hypothetical protein